MLHEHFPLRFECTGCGRCCIGGGDYEVFLSEREAERIRAHLQLSRSWFRRRYLRLLPDGDLVAAKGENDRCTFLGPDNRCRVYAARPVQCRTYPFWPEVLRSRTAWAREAKRCEGIDRGSVVPISHIRKALARTD